MTNKTKKLELLVVEDNELHMKDAKLAVAALTKQGITVTADYATTLDEALAKVNTKKYDGIVTDVFYPIKSDESEIRATIASKLKEYVDLKDPYNEIKDTEKLMQYLKAYESGNKNNSLGEYMQDIFETDVLMGMSYAHLISDRKCVRGKGMVKTMKKDEDIMNSINAKVEQTQKRIADFSKAFADWSQGIELAPAGVYLAEQVGRRNIVFCTDSYHHGMKTEPVHRYANHQTIEKYVDEKGIELSPEEESSLIKMMDVSPDAEKSELGAKKDWATAISYALKLEQK